MTYDRDQQAAAEEAEWQRTGRIRCSDCGTKVTTSTLVTLPEHGCSRRQAARRQCGTTHGYEEHK
ncbi:hypothetical protein OG689_10725 [Kitasatospora sp. NBC_00240]|uniref:hypothetical protein n=1 Tax=Kitasatospora sp. NBC_00240 TaxID=2903567 RepID=UPI0022542619|nr:hypothetical protein [Kitasatospora sp. NBC_00240]MCX5209757.1 hypothetical protein [Kitasatospora sp. NBC_00240]